MDTKQKIFFILFLFSSNFFSLTNIDLTEISKANEEEKVTKTKIFKDSLVFIDKENKFNFSGFKQKGIYKFIEDKNNLNSDNLFFKNFSTGNDEISENYRVVQFPDKSFGITDGGLIIFFEDDVDKTLFALDYELSLMDTYSFGASYKPKGFNEIDSLIERIQNDSRVKKLEFNLMLNYKVN